MERWYLHNTGTHVVEEEIQRIKQSVQKTRDEDVRRIADKPLMISRASEVYALDEEVREVRMHDGDEVQSSASAVRGAAEEHRLAATGYADVKHVDSNSAPLRARDSSTKGVVGAWNTRAKSAHTSRRRRAVKRNG